MSERACTANVALMMQIIEEQPEQRRQLLVDTRTWLVANAAVATRDRLMAAMATVLGAMEPAKRTEVETHRGDGRSHAFCGRSARRAAHYRGNGREPVDGRKVAHLVQKTFTAGLSGAPGRAPGLSAPQGGKTGLLPSPATTRTSSQAARRPEVGRLLLASWPIGPGSMPIDAWGHAIELFRFLSTRRHPRRRGDREHGKAGQKRGSRGGWSPTREPTFGRLNTCKPRPTGRGRKTGEVRPK
jgi:hypothetical protein